MKKLIFLPILLLSIFSIKAMTQEELVIEDQQPITNQTISIEPKSVMQMESQSTAAVTKKLVYGQPKDVVQNLTPVVQAEHPATIGQATSIGQEARENTKAFSRVSNFSDPSRFMQIKATPEVAMNEIDFWSRQMSEHALFAHLGLEDPELKQKALETFLAFEDFRKKFKQNPRDMRLMNSILPLLEKERAFQVEALKMIESGKWIGWIFPLFLNHVTLELDYFVDKLNGIKYSPEDEVLFWNRINSEHAAFAAHLLDPSERELFVKADQMSLKFMNIPKSEKEMMIRLSLVASKELDEFNKKAQSAGKAVQSIIHPVLLAHVIREGERSIKTLTDLGLHKEAQKFARQYDKQLTEYSAEPMTQPMAQPELELIETDELVMN